MSDIIKVKALCKKLIMNKGDWYCWSMQPITPFDERLRIHPIYHNFSVSGELSFLTEGKEFVLEVEETKGKYDFSYKVVSCDLGVAYDLDNLTYEASMAIMCEITTKKQAKNCLDAYEDFIKIALTQGVDGFDIDKIYNVKDYRLNAYVRELNVKFKYLNIINKFKEWGFDISEAKQLCSMYDDKESSIKKAIRENPYYVLIDVLDRKFEKADTKIMELRPDLEVSEVRCAYLVASVVAKNEEESKDTKVKARDVYSYIINTYPIANKLKPLLVPVITENPLFHYDEEEQTIALTSTYMAEYNIATFFYDKVINSTPLDIDYTKYTEIKDGTLTEEQQDILRNFCECNLTIVNAKGGTGKSASTMALIEMLEDNDMSYMIVCPTGKVAKRLTELTGKPASTIHKAVLTHDDGIWADCIIVEEGSMIGLDVMTMLINSLANPNCRIIINLDLRQIAPLSCGCPLRDIIFSDIANINKLSVVFRYGEGGLAKMASDAHDQKVYIKDIINEDKATIGKNKDYTYIRYKDVETTIKTILDTYKYYMSEYKAKPKDITVITPWDVSGLGSIVINNEVQKLVNPVLSKDKTITKNIRGFNVTFKVGDIILNTENNYNVPTLEGYNLVQEDGEITQEDVESGICMNGELGRIVDIFDGNMAIQFDEDILVFDKFAQDNLKLGYSLNSYKMQGSETPYLITVLAPMFMKSLDSNIAYTDISRGKKVVTEIIDPNTLIEAMKIDSIKNRLTNMQKIFKGLKEEYAKTNN